MEVNRSKNLYDGLSVISIKLSTAEPIGGRCLVCFTECACLAYRSCRSRSSKGRTRGIVLQYSMARCCFFTYNRRFIEEGIIKLRCIEEF